MPIIVGYLLAKKDVGEHIDQKIIIDENSIVITYFTMKY